MKKLISKVSKTVAFLFGLAVAGTSVISCDNFMNAALIKEEIAKQIEIANAQELNIQSFSPVLNETGESRDSSIIITFSKALSKENDFSKIKITGADGESVASYYRPAVINGNILTIAADKSKLMNIADGNTKTITVIVPSGFYYDEAGSKLVINSDISNTFRINNSTNDKAEITFGVDSEKGTVTPSGTFKYSKDETVSIKFEPREGYNFTGWSITDTEGKDASAYVEIADATALKTKITVRENITGINIRPTSDLIPEIMTAPNLINAGVCYDLDLIFKFNKKIDAQTVILTSEEDPFGGSINILNFADLNQHCEKYFTLESEDNKIILVPKTQIKELVSEADSVFTFKIEFNANEKFVKDTEGNNLEGITSYVYKINSSYEDVPLRMAIKAAKDENGLSSATALITQGTFETQSENITNFFTEKYHAKSVYFDFNIFDEVGGPEKLVIQEKLLYTTDGVDLSKKNYTSVKEIDLTSMNPLNGYYKGIVEYEFDKDLPDGIVELTVTPVDVYGREGAAVTYAVIKDAVFKPKCEVLAFGSSGYDSETSTYKVSVAKASSKIMYVCLYDEICATYGNNVYKKVSDDFDIDIKLYDKNGTLVEAGNLIDTIPYPSDSCVEYYYSFERLNGDDDFTFKTIIKDKNNLEYYNEYVLYACPKVKYAGKTKVEDKNTNEIVPAYELIFDLDSNSYWTKESISILWEEIDSDGNIVNSGVNDNDGNRWNSYGINAIPVSDNVVYYYISCSMELSDGWVYSSLSSAQVINNSDFEDTSDYSQIAKPTFTSCITPVESLNSNQIKISIDASSCASDFDYMIANVSSDEQESSYVLDNGKIIIDYNILHRWDLEPRIYVYGVKNGVRYISDTKNYDLRTDDLQKDFCSPQIKVNSVFSISKSDRKGDYDYIHVQVNDFPKYDVTNLLKDNKLTLECYWTPTWKDSETFSSAEIKNLPYHKTFTFTDGIDIQHSIDADYDRNSIRIPIEEFSMYDGSGQRIAVFFSVKDNDGNECYTNTVNTFTFQMLKTPLTINTGNKIEYNEMKNQHYTYISMNSFNTTTNKWENEFTEKRIGGTFMYSSTYNYWHTNNRATVEAKKRFIETYVNFDGKYFNSDHYMTAPLIVYYTNNPADRVCEAKSYIYNKNLTVISDKPAFVHTIYSPVDFGDDAGKWERYAYYKHRINPKVLNLSSTCMYKNYDIDLSLIPDEYKDSYKVVIIHYADGTTEVVRIK